MDIPALSRLTLPLFAVAILGAAEEGAKPAAGEHDLTDPAVAAKLKESHPELFKRIDTNGDGTISADEAKAAKERREQMREKFQTKMQEHLDQTFKEADKDGDGKLDRTEFGAAIAAVHKHLEKQREERGKNAKEDKNAAPAGAH